MSGMVRELIFKSALFSSPLKGKKIKNGKGN
jgi:hypothetical protein